MTGMVASPEAWLFAALGLVFGSFASALSFRLPRGMGVVADRSRCPHCDAVLGARDLVPLLSWVLGGRRCRHCGAAISWRYPAIELATAALFAAAWWRGGGDLVAAVLLAATMFGLMVILVSDLETSIIPDLMLLALLPVAALWRWHAGGNWLDGGAGLVLGAGLSWAARAAFRRWRGRQGLGLGDVKFLGMAGLYLGANGLGPYLALSGILGILLGLAWRLAGRGPVFPFGPALCVTLALGLFWPGLVDLFMWQ